MPFAVAAVALALTGCAMQPIICNRSGATRADYDRDVAQCEYESASATVTYGSSTPPARTLGGAIGQGIGIGMGRAMARNDLAIMCMRAKGWRPSGEMPASYAQPAPSPVVVPVAEQQLAVEAKYLFSAQQWAKGMGCEQPFAAGRSRGCLFQQRDRPRS